MRNRRRKCWFIAMLALLWPGPRLFAQSQPADAAVARAEIDKLLAEAESTPKDMSHADALRLEGDRYEAIARRIEAFLKAYPNDSAADRFTVARLRAMYWTATARGHELDPIQAELDRIDIEKARPLVRVAVSYWQARLARRALIIRSVDQGEETPATGPTAKVEEFRGPPERIMNEFARRYPESPAAAALSTTEVMRSLEQQDSEHAAQWLDLLKKHHPNYVALASLEAEAALREGMGKSWAPPLKTVDDRIVDWAAMKGRIGLVLFWSPRYRPSVTLMRRVQAFVAEHPDALNVVAITIDDDVPGATAAAADIGFTGQLVHDGLGWRSPLARKYGIRLLPTALFLDRAGNLVAIERLGRRQLSAECIARLGRMVQSAGATPADSQPTEQDDGVALPSSGE